MRTSVSAGSAAPADSMVVAAAGLCCSLGYHVRAAVCAMRANMDHFHESTFQDLSSNPVNVAALPDDLFGDERLMRWLEYALRDCARDAGPESLFDPASTSVIMLAPDRTRPHADADRYRELAGTVINRLRREYGQQHEARREASFDIGVIEQGRTSLGPALLQAARHLTNVGAGQILLLGLDSYLNAADINIYLGAERLFVKGNTNGFVPGEAACAVLLRRAAPDAPGLHVRGVATAQEPGRHDGSVPSKSDGLTKAVRAACAQAGMAPVDLAFRMSDQNGEQFFANDATNAFTRLMFGAHRLTHVTLADKIGETGAAAGPAMLSWLLSDLNHSATRPGNAGLIHLANDDGTRCAVVVQYQGEQ